MSDGFTFFPYFYGRYNHIYYKAKTNNLIWDFLAYLTEMNIIRKKAT